MSAREEFDPWKSEYIKSDSGKSKNIDIDMFASFQAGLEAAAKVCDGLYNDYEGYDAMDCAEQIRKIKD